MTRTFGPQIGRLVGSAAIVAILVIAALANVGQHAPPGELADLGSFLHAGALADEGQNPYGPYAHGVNLNAPLSVLPFQWLTRLDPRSLYIHWYLLSLGIYGLALLFLWLRYPESRSPWRVAWALVWGSLWSSLWDGQIYTVLVLLTTLTWLLMEHRNRPLAGALIGLLCAIKPNYLVWPALLAISGSWEIAMAAGMTIAVLGFIPVVVYGPGIYVQWYHAASQVTNLLEPANASLAGASARFGAPTWAGLGCSVLFLVALALWAWRAKPAQHRVTGVALVAAILASPLGWVDYTLLLLPVFLSRRWTWPWTCAALILVTFMGYTWWMLRTPHWILATIGQYATVAVLLVLVGLLRASNGVSPAAAPKDTWPKPPSRVDVPVKTF